MNVAPEITFRDVQRSEALDALIQRRIEHLERVCDHVSSCRVVVEEPQQHMSSGSPYRVRIDVTVPPGHEVVGRREPGQGDLHEELGTVIRDAFDAVERQLDEITEKQHGDVKAHPAQEANGIIDRVLRSSEYGFLKSVESGQDIYFHKNSVLHDDFERLEPGVGVYYEAELGDDGYQATTVRIVDKPGERRGK